MDNNTKNNTPASDTENLQPASGDETQKIDTISSFDENQAANPDRPRDLKPVFERLEMDEVIAIAHQPEESLQKKTETPAAKANFDESEPATLAKEENPEDKPQLVQGPKQPDTDPITGQERTDQSEDSHASSSSNINQDQSRKTSLPEPSQKAADSESKKPEDEEGSFIADELALNRNAAMASHSGLPDIPSKSMPKSQRNPSGSEPEAQSHKTHAAQGDQERSTESQQVQSSFQSSQDLPPKPEPESRTGSGIPPVPEDALSIEEQSIEEMKKDFSAGWKSLVHPAEESREARTLRIAILIVSVLLFIGLLLPFLTVRADFYGEGNLSRSFSLISTWAGWLYLILLITLDGFVILDKRSLALVFGVVPAFLLVFAALYNVITGLIAIHDTGYFLFRIALSSGFYVLMLDQIVLTVLCVIYFIKDPARKKRI